MWHVTSGELECHGRSKIVFHPIQSYFESRRPLVVTAWRQLEYGSSMSFLVALQPVHGGNYLLYRREYMAIYRVPI